MPITYLSTSIFDSPAQALVCPVNCVGVMGAGLALEFHRRFPGLLVNFRRMRIAPGEPTFWETSERSNIVCLFPTKDHWRNRSEIWMIEAGLAKLVADWIPTTWTARGMAFPKLGCGLGGLRWTEVRPIMERYLGELSIEVYVHV